MKAIYKYKYKNGPQKTSQLPLRLLANRRFFFDKLRDIAKHKAFCNIPLYMHLGKSSGLQLYIRRLRIGIRFAMAHLRHAQEGKSERNRAVNKERPITRRATERTAQDRADDRGGEGGCVIISGEGAHLLRRADIQNNGQRIDIDKRHASAAANERNKDHHLLEAGHLLSQEEQGKQQQRPAQTNQNRFLSADLLAQLSGRNCKNHQ